MRWILPLLFLMVLASGCTESITSEISCANHELGSDYDPNYYTCKDDCPEDQICHTRNCTCQPLPTDIDSAMDQLQEGAIKKGGDIQENNTEEEIELIFSEPKGLCTPDPFEVGEIKVYGESGSSNWEVAGDGYEAGVIYYNWQTEHTGEYSTVAGIGANFRVIGPSGEKIVWTRTDESGALKGTHAVWEKGNYTVEIVDFETHGSYCGDGNKINVVVE